MHSCTHTLYVGWKQQKQLVCQAVWTHLSSICRLLLTDTRKETREVATVCHALILSTLVNKFFILRQKQNIDALSNNLTQINLDKHIYSTMSPLHLFYSLPHFLPPTVDACLEQIRGSELPYDSSCNGYRFVRWPDSAAPPLGHRCHSHGTEEQMFVKGEKRGRWRGVTNAAWDRHETSVCTCKYALGIRHVYRHAPRQLHTCRKSLASYEPIDIKA